MLDPEALGDWAPVPIQEQGRLFYVTKSFFLDQENEVINARLMNAVQMWTRVVELKRSDDKSQAVCAFLEVQLSHLHLDLNPV